MMRRKACIGRTGRQQAIVTAVLTALATIGCAQGGSASQVLEALMDVAMEMNQGGSVDRTWSYNHATGAPYSLVVAPARTSASALDAIAFPKNWLEAAKDCINSGQAVVIVAETQVCTCARPVEMPNVRAFFAVHKAAGEQTVFKLQKNTGEPIVTGVE